jgi:serine/threonine-protein kinase
VRPAAGTRLGDRYLLEARIAVGGMGEVWSAQDEVLTRPVAVKILREEYSTDPDFLERFRGEARHAAALSHPGIAAVYDYGEAEGSDEVAVRPYLVMELVPGEPLSAIIARTGGLGADETLDVIGQTALALQAAHDAGVVHRDVKPGNLVVTPDHVVKVTDFGIARATNAVPITRTGQIMGTAHTISPEQAAGAPVTPLSDIYSLGIVAYECLSGRRPFDGGTPVSVALAQVRDQPPTLPSNVPEPVRALVLRMLAKDPADRPASAGELGREALALRHAGAVPTGATRSGVTALLPSVGTEATSWVGAEDGNTSPSGPPAALVAAAPALERIRRGHRESPPWLWVAAAGAAVLILLLTFRACSSGSDPGANSPTGTGTTTSPARSTPTSVTVDEAKYLGRPVDDVVAELRRLGLVVRTRTGDQRGKAGTVTGVTPTGSIAPGATVTVTAVGDKGKKENGE